jgi:D-alanyl-D-alanine carboxypeptidase/D-alanyl-D-alanine-endopeptidase (penicillin-binding protein 4)
MKNWLFILVLISTSALAFDRYEDTAENLAPQLETNRSAPEAKRRGQGTWTYAFELLEADGSSTILSESQRDVMVKPASTMKIFTGWFAYKQNYRDTTYLSKMLKESVNAMADATLKEMGGTKVLTSFYADQGLTLNSSNFIQVDGSGLSYDNKTNCAAEIELLKLIHRDPSYEDFKVLMARPGEEGTLKDRLLSLKEKLFAKTGTLNKTASLSGFVETDSGTVVFCVLTDYLPGPSRNYRPRIDAMVLKNVENLGR